MKKDELHFRILPALRLRHFSQQIALHELNTWWDKYIVRHDGMIDIDASVAYFRRVIVWAEKHGTAMKAQWEEKGKPPRSLHYLAMMRSADYIALAEYMIEHLQKLFT
jgi:hypothetical protein